MPKKTKKQKLLAQLRKKTHQPNVGAYTTPVQAQKESAYTFTVKSMSQSQSKPISETAVAEFTAIRKDLAFTVMLAAIFIFIEYILALKL